MARGLRGLGAALTAAIFMGGMGLAGAGSIRPAEGAPEDNSFTRASIKLISDGTGHGTKDASAINTKNGYRVGDDSATDGVVSTNDQVLYQVSIRFDAGPQRTVKIKTDLGQLIPDKNSFCVGGLGFTATQVSSSECHFAVKAGAVGSIDGNLVGLAVPTRVGVASARLWISEVEQQPANEVLIVAAPQLDAMLLPGGSLTQTQQTKGANTFRINFKDLHTEGYSKEKGRYRAGNFSGHLDVSDFPNGTTFKIAGVDAPVDNGKVYLNDLKIPDTFESSSIDVKVQLPEGSYPTQEGDTAKEYSVNLVIDPTSIQYAGLKNNGDGSEPGAGEDANFSTRDPKKGSVEGISTPNNNFLRLRWIYEPITGSVLGKSLYGPSEDGKTIFESGYREYAKDEYPLKYNERYIAGQPVTANAQTTSEITVNTAELASQSQQLSVCDSWDDYQRWDNNRSFHVYRGNSSEVNNALYMVEYSDTRDACGSPGDANQHIWDRTPTDATRSVRVSFPEGVIAKDSGTWKLLIPLKVKGDLVEADHGKEAWDTARITSTSAKLEDSGAQVSRYFKLALPRPQEIHVSHRADAKVVKPGERVKYTVDPWVSNRISSSEPVNVSGTITLDGCTTNHKITSLPDGWKADYIPAKGVNCTESNYQPAKFELTYSGTPSVTSYNRDPITDKPIYVPTHTTSLLPRIEYTSEVTYLAKTDSNLIDKTDLVLSLAAGNGITTGSDFELLTVLSSQTTEQFLSALTPKQDFDTELLWRYQIYSRQNNATGKLSGTIILPRNDDDRLAKPATYTDPSINPDGYQLLKSNFNGSYTLDEIKVDAANTSSGTLIEYSTTADAGIEGKQISWQPWRGLPTSGVTAIRVTTPEGNLSSADIQIKLVPQGNKAGDVYLMHDLPLHYANGNAAAPANWPVNERIVESAISGRVWFDDNNDAANSSTEPGVKDITVELYKDGTLVKKTRTDDTGNYKFETLKSGDYEVRMTRTQQLTKVTTRYGETLDVNQTYSYDQKYRAGASTTAGVRLGVGAKQDNVDFGFFKPDPHLILDKSPAGVNQLDDNLQEVTWTVTMQNLGNTVISNASLTDTMSAALFDVAAEASYYKLVQVAAGTSHSLAVTGSGEVYAFGDNYSGQLGLGNTRNQNSPVKVAGLSNVTQVAAGSNHSLAVTGSGEVFAFGFNYWGQLGLGNTSSQFSPVKVAGLSNVTQVAAGQYHSLAVTGSGEVYAFGSSGYGQLGLGDTTKQLSPVKVPGLSNVTQVAAGHYHSLAVTGSGEVYAFGYNYSGQLGLGNKTDQSSPVKVPGLSNVTQVAAGYGHSLAVTGSGEVFAFGDNSSGRLGLGNISSQSSPVKVPGLSNVIQVAAGSSHSLAVTGSGEVFAFGFNSSGQLGLGNTIGQSPSPVKVAGLSNVTQVAAGSDHSLVVTGSGEVFAFGDNSSGQLGLGNTSSQFSPVKVPGLSNVTQVAAGQYHSLAVTGSGEVYAFGSNSWGQLGLGNKTNQSSPVKVPGLSNVTQVAADSGHSLAVTGSGEVFAFGFNSSGQLGLGNKTNQSSPVKVAGLSNVTQVAAGGNYSLAVTGSGEVFAFGDNSSGQLGLGNTSSQSIPVKVPGLSNVTQVAAGGGHSLAVTGSGDVYAFGNNSSGQLGLGNTSSQSIPVKVAGLSNVTQVAAGGGHSLAVTGSGEVYAFGFNYTGQLGLGNKTNQSSPVKVPGLSNVTQVAAGHYHSLAVTGSGEVYAFGSNYSGQLGLGNKTDQSSPVKVPGLSNVTQVAAGGGHSLAITDRDLYYFSGQYPQRVLFPMNVIHPTSEKTADGYTERSYDLLNIRPGETATVRFTAKARQTKQDQYFSNQAWVTGITAPKTRPELPKPVTATNYNAEGGEPLNVTGCTATGNDGDRCDITPVRIPKITKSTGSLSGTLWQDDNMDGIRQPGEPRRAGSKVKIYRGDQLIGEVKTDANGFWKMTDLLAGDNYAVEYAATGKYGDKNWMYTKQAQGADRSVDSDVNIAGRIEGITIVANQETMYQDAGVVPTTVKIAVYKKIQDDGDVYGDNRVLGIQPATGFSQARTVQILVKNDDKSTEPVSSLTLTDVTTSGPAVKDLKYVSGGTIDGTLTISGNQVNGLTINPGETAVFEATLGQMEPGTTHENTATVTGSSTITGIPVTASDATQATVSGAKPAITVKKYFNDKTPDTPTGKTADEQDSDANDNPVNVDKPELTASYVVTNTGNMPLYNISMYGPLTGTITDCKTKPDVLLPGKSFTCVRTETIPDGTAVIDSPVTVTGLTKNQDGEPSGSVTASDDAKAQKPFMFIPPTLPPAGSWLSYLMVFSTFVLVAGVTYVAMRRQQGEIGSPSHN